MNDEKIQKSIFDKEVIEAVKKDYEYLKKMKEMDMKISNAEKGGEEGEEGQRKKLEMTDVVPVGGLIMARFFLIIILFSILVF